MAGASSTREFFENGSTGQFEWVLSHYDQALKLKAENKSSKPENVIKLDKWYQTELPKKIKARGKEAHLIHDELVQTIKWKLARGKFQANMLNLVQMNTPRVVMTETKKAFRKLEKTQDLQAAAQALCNLKGVGPTMASAVLAAGAPHLAPFMADECLLAMPDGESLDYTMKEYMRFVEYVQNCVDRLKSQGGDWTPHKVELAIWTHYVMNEYKPEILMDMPGKNAASHHAAPASTPKPTPAAAASIESNGTDQDTNGSASTSDEEGRGDVSSVANGEDSVSSPPPPAMRSTPSPVNNIGDASNNGGNSTYDDDSSQDKNGSDSNHVANFSSCENSNDRTVSELIPVASNGGLQENGAKEVLLNDVSETNSPDPVSIHPTPEDLPVEKSTSDSTEVVPPQPQVAKRTSEVLEEPTSEVVEEPPTKKLKPEEQEPLAAAVV